MIQLALRGLLRLAAEVPVDPDREEARRWVQEELSKNEYVAAKPTWWDVLSQGFWEWLNSFTVNDDIGVQAPIVALFLLLIIGAIVAAFFIFGKPRINRRSALVGSLFGVDEDRDAESMRRAAEAAAARQDWTLAIEELFRALARSLEERALVGVNPGTTANGFAQRAGTVFPEHLQRLSASAAVFDEVRYLGHDGTETDYATLVGLERELRTARPPLTLLASGAGAL